MLSLHANLGIVLLVVTLGFLVYAWLARRADAPPLGLRLTLMGIAVLLLVQFGAGTGMLAQGHWIIGSHYGTAQLAVPLLVLPVLARGYRPSLWMASAVGLFLVVLGTAFIGWSG
jgi:hypothetical protein